MTPQGTEQDSIAAGAILRTAKPSKSTSSLTRTAKCKRQVASCDSGCTMECADLGEQPFVSGCDILTSALESLSPESFLAPAGTITTFTDAEEGTCEYSYVNLDIVEYSVCFLDLGFNGIVVGDDCFADFPGPTATYGGFCVSPGVPDDDWILE
ncbi:hypothetical protein OBBRIDRAFT_801693 [Obba rivulosa]|uniref:Uncharacterized protein n=1 Tax=Obba rivulosa TaxID=1052685 RepID=A0A8E2DQ71_9APHY|nr:hypothetical protein OBBRIDRAFT_801693 [Obba rivulosa]